MNNKKIRIHWGNTVHCVHSIFQWRGIQKMVVHVWNVLTRLSSPSGYKISWKWLLSII